jgi:hypothetical protein
MRRTHVVVFACSCHAAGVVIELVERTPAGLRMYARLKTREGRVHRLRQAVSAVHSRYERRLTDTAWPLTT